MLLFAVAISCLTTSNLPWFVDLTFQVPMQYFFLQHQTLLPSPVTFTAGCCFCFGCISSFFLELFLHWSPVAFWAPTDLGSSSFSILSFCLLILFMGFSRQKYWSDLPFPSPVDHILSEISPMIHPSWVALQSITLGRHSLSHQGSLLETKWTYKPEWGVKLKIYHLSSGNRFEMWLACLSFCVRKYVLGGRDTNENLHWQIACKLRIIIIATFQSSYQICLLSWNLDLQRSF